MTYRIFHIFAKVGSENYGFATDFGLYLKDSSFSKDNTPPMPLFDAHLGGFSFLNHE